MKRETRWYAIELMLFLSGGMTTLAGIILLVTMLKDCAQ